MTRRHENMGFEEQEEYAEKISNCHTLHEASLIDANICSAFEINDRLALALRSELEQRMAERLFTSLSVAGVNAADVATGPGVRLADVLARTKVIEASMAVEQRTHEPMPGDPVSQVAKGILACENVRDCIGLLKQAGLWDKRCGSLPEEVDQAMMSFFRTQAQATAHVAKHKAIATAIEENLADEAFFHEAEEKAGIREEATFALLMEAYREGRNEPVSQEEWGDKLAVEEVIRQKRPTQ